MSRYTKPSPMCTHSITAEWAVTEELKEVAVEHVHTALAASQFRWGIRYAYAMRVGAGIDMSPYRTFVGVEHSSKQPLCKQSEELLRSVYEAWDALARLQQLPGAR